MQFVKVFFKVTAETYPGQEIGLIGNVPQLGSWDISKSLRLETNSSSYPQWSHSEHIKLQAGECIEYKILLFEGGSFSRWETIAFNREVVVGRCNVFYVEDQMDTPIHRFHLIQSPNSSESVSKQQNINKNERRRSSEQKCDSEYSDGVKIVLYQLPVKMWRSNGSWEACWDHEAFLAHADESCHRNNTPVHWVGLPPVFVEEHEQQHVVRILDALNCVPVFVPKDRLEQHAMFCKTTLWPNFHNIIDIYGEHPTLWWNYDNQQNLWASYIAVNTSFCDKLVEQTSGCNLIWVHDYQLMLLPSFLMKKLPSNKIGFFLHTPFPSSEIFRTLSIREEIMIGILGADHIGFHLFEYARHFLTCCRRLFRLSHEPKKGGTIQIDYHGRKIGLTVSHLGIEPQLIDSIMSEKNFDTNSLLETANGRTIIGCIDPLERLRGITLKLNAYKAFLEYHPEYTDRIIFVQWLVVDDSLETDLQEIKTILDSFESNVIDFRILPQKENTLALRCSFWAAIDVMVSTCVREGLDLSPLEYSYVKNNPAGVTIVSEFSAASRVLPGALRVNPWKQDEVFGAIDVALNMEPGERLARRVKDIEFISGNTSALWAERALTDLRKAIKPEPGRKQAIGLGLRSQVVFPGAGFFDPLPVENVLKSYRRSSSSKMKRVIFLDFGGTLASEENLPKYHQYAYKMSEETIRPSERTMRALRGLCASPLNEVFIVSGRERSELMRVFGEIPGLGLAAEQGCYFKFGERSVNSGNCKFDEWEELLPHLDYSWKQLAFNLMSLYTKRTNGTYIEKKGSTILWQYRDADPEFGAFQAKEMRDHLEGVLKNFHVELLPGKGYLEVRPSGIDKGVIVKRILQQVVKNLSKGEKVGMIMAIGDDSIDEPMFNAIKKSSIKDEAMVKADLFTCTVGKKDSNAMYYIDGPNDVENLLESMGSIGM
eukprot:TRINITY_DN2160_c0_g1_i1.p1 TRINITY_DN2160_c0_g1~~TRINITY_DN2160_c0_g1_i1.p1  ORF type:complete len:938 (-),score=163.23 TRINITY_DN2160_c0_g1_i1:414-3227(-)